jgi:3-hydroxyisobutyrate dehydrogenase-like beta-hydroxyacid dehydrogenase
MTSERIGFIGLGFMGRGMAANLLAKGFPLTILGHRNRAPIEALVAKGATEVKTPAEVARASTIVFLCVTGSPEVEANMRGPDGLLAGAAPGTVIIDCTTADPTSTLQLASEAAAVGVTFVDAPLGGTPAQAEAGQLSAMVGTDEATYARIEPVIRAWAAKSVRIGAVGDGHKMKLLNNFVSLGYASIYAEALTLAQKTGISPQVFDSVLRGSRMDCGFYQTFFDWVINRNPEAHKFTLANALKDVRYLDGLANAAGVANPVGSAVKNAFATAVASGHGGDFVPTLSDFVAGLNGVSLAPDPDA